MDPKRFPDSLIETVRDRNDVVAVISEYLTLKRSGQNHTGLCPFHHEKTPSFVVSPAKQIFHCFGCGAGGNVFQFLIKIEGLSFPEAIRRLAEKAGVALPAAGADPKENSARQEAEALYRLNDEAAAYFHRNLLESKEGAEARAYLKAREITPETIEAFSIGFASPRRDDLLKRFVKKFPVALLEKGGLVSRKPGAPPGGAGSLFDRFRNRVMFPIRTAQGKVAGFGGRVLDPSTPKYLNTPETPIFTKGKHLFGIDRVKGKAIHSLIVVEGYFDAVAAHQAGIPNVVATLGTALTQDHLQAMGRVAEKVVLIFDPDEAGVRAALRAAPLFIEKGISAEVVSLPAGEDPDLFIRNQGKERFLQRTTEGRTLIDFSILKLSQSSSPKSIDDKMKVIENILPLLHKLKSPIEQSHYLKNLSEELAIDEESLRKEFVKQAKKGGGTFSQRRTAPAGEKVRLPQDEETLLAFLLQDRLDPSRLNREIDPDDFTHPEIRSLVSHFWNASHSRWHTPQEVKDKRAVFDGGEAEEKPQALFRRLSVLEIEGDHMEQTIEDCIISLRRKRLHREGSEVEKQLKLAEKGGDRAASDFLSKKLLDLKKELSHLTLSHSIKG